MSDAAAAPSAAPATNGATAPSTSSTPTPAAATNGATATGPQSPSTSAPATTAPKEPYKLKFMDGDREIEWDEGTLKRNAQVLTAADRRMNDATKLQQRLERALAEARESPDEVLKLAGIDPDQWAQERIRAKFEAEQLPEHDRKLREYEQKIKEFEEREQRRTMTEKEREQARLVAEQEKEIDTSYSKALESFGFRPQTDPKHRDFELGMLVPLMAQEEAFLSRAGLRVTPEDLAARTNQRLDVLMQHRLSSLAPEALVDRIEAIMPGAFDRMARVVLARRAAPKETVTPPATPQPPPQKKPLTKMTPDQEREELQTAASMFNRRGGRW